MQLLRHFTIRRVVLWMKILSVAVVALAVSYGTLTLREMYRHADRVDALTQQLAADNAPVFAAVTGLKLSSSRRCWHSATAICWVNELIGQIALAPEEQSKEIAQVTLAVTKPDRVTQQNATLVQQVTATAGSLNGQTTALGSAVTRFRLPSVADGLRMAVPQVHPHQMNPPAAASPEGNWVAFVK